MTVPIVPRAEIGVPEPSPARPRLAWPCPSLLIHYVGAGSYGDRTVPDRTEARRVAAYGITANKRWEYNYMVGWEGHVYEQAGIYRAAHCLNFNSQSMGVLCLLGIKVTPSRAMVDSVRMLRAQFIAEGRLAASSEMVPHYRYRSTDCCSQLAEPHGVMWSSPTGEGYLGDLIPALLDPYEMEDDDMTPVLFGVEDFAAYAIDPYSGMVHGLSGSELAGFGFGNVADIPNKRSQAELDAALQKSGQTRVGWDIQH